MYQVPLENTITLILMIHVQVVVEGSIVKAIRNAWSQASAVTEGLTVSVERMKTGVLVSMELT